MVGVAVERPTRSKARPGDGHVRALSRGERAHVGEVRFAQGDRPGRRQGPDY